MLVPKYRAILNASSIDGLYRPFSSEIMVWRDTSSASASSSWLSPRPRRSSSSLFFTVHLQKEKLALHLQISIPSRYCQVCFTSSRKKQPARAGCLSLYYPELQLELQYAQHGLVYPLLRDRPSVHRAEHG